MEKVMDKSLTLTGKRLRLLARKDKSAISYVLLISKEDPESKRV
jgi:hypothetical protein